MRSLSGILCSLALVALTSCSGGKPADKTDKTGDALKSGSAEKTASAEPAATAKTESSEPAKTAEVKTEAPKTVEPAKTVAAKTEAPVLPAKSGDKPEWGKAHPEESLDLGGRTIGFWVNELAQKDKAKLLEALEYCRMAEKRASRGIPMLQKLSTHADKEIAAAAAEALKVVK